MNVNFYKVLKKFGTTKAGLRTIFTAHPSKLTGDTEQVFKEKKADMEADRGPLSKKEEKALKQSVVDEFYNRKIKWTRRIQNRIEEGRTWALKNYRFYITADLAWDSVPIIPEDIPLQLYAQGRINLTQCHDRLRKCVDDDSMTGEQLDSMFVKDPDHPEKIKAMNLPRLHEVSVNLIRSMIRRRVAAQANKYNDLYPYYKYEPREKTMVSKLRADVLSQRVETMTDSYDYRSEFTQDLRKNFLYSHATSFVEKAWDKQKQYRMKSSPAGELEIGETEEKNEDVEEYITREGVKFVSPHPTRVFYDMQHSLASINKDQGCKYLGYWDVVRWRDIGDNPNFFNREAVNFSDSNHFSNYNHYFSYYYESAKTIKFPTHGGDDIEEGNKRDTNFDIYSDSNGDDAVWVTNYYEKIIPKDVGLGRYPHPVWVRLQVASDTTIVFAEILPSTPAAYMGHDEDHSKILNQAMSHEMIPYNDQIKNLFSQALYLMKIQSMVVMTVDTDTLNEEQVQHIRNIANSTEYYSKMLLVEHSASDDEETFEKPIDNRKPIDLVQTQAQLGTVINELLSNVTNVIALLEKTQMMSPQESGSFASGERVTAQEVNEVSQTTNSLFSFISEGPDQYRAAKKKILFESLMALGDKEIGVYVQERYPDEVIASAGFTPKLTSASAGYELNDADMQAITGNLEDLPFEIVFNSRDGSERTINSESAKVIADLTRYIFSTPDIFQIFVDNFGIEQFTNMISEAFRLSGAGFVLKVPPTAQGRQEQIASVLGQLQEIIEKQGQTQEQTQAQVDELKSNINLLAQSLGATPQAPPAPTPPVIPTGEGGPPVSIEGPLPPNTPPTVLTDRAQ